MDTSQLVLLVAVLSPCLSLEYHGFDAGLQQPLCRPGEGYRCCGTSEYLLCGSGQGSSGGVSLLSCPAHSECVTGRGAPARACVPREVCSSRGNWPIHGTAFCELYYSCGGSGDQAVIESCPPGHIFNAAQGACLLSSDPCLNPSCHPGTRTPDPSDCRRYHECDSRGHSTLYDCPLSLYFDISSQSCSASTHCGARPVHGTSHGITQWPGTIPQPVPVTAQWPHQGQNHHGVNPTPSYGTTHGTNHIYGQNIGHNTGHGTNNYGTNQGNHFGMTHGGVPGNTYGHGHNTGYGTNQGTHHYYGTTHGMHDAITPGNTHGSHGHHNMGLDTRFSTNPGYGGNYGPLSSELPSSLSTTCAPGTQFRCHPYEPHLYFECDRSGGHTSGKVQQCYRDEVCYPRHTPTRPCGPPPPRCVSNGKFPLLDFTGGCEVYYLCIERDILGQYEMLIRSCPVNMEFSLTSQGCQPSGRCQGNLPFPNPLLPGVGPFHSSGAPFNSSHPRPTPGFPGSPSVSRPPPRAPSTPHPISVSLITTSTLACEPRTSDPDLAHCRKYYECDAKGHREHKTCIGSLKYDVSRSRCALFADCGDRPDP